MFGHRRSVPAIAAVLFFGSVCSAAAADPHTTRHRHPGYGSLEYPRTARGFDGSWQITANTRGGSCGPSFGFRVAVVNGRVVSSGVAGVSGRVTSGGSVSVTVRQSSGTVVGAGRLSASSGRGRWTASSPSGRCAGYWYAQRGY
jgi:hypothetical protein